MSHLQRLLLALLLLALLLLGIGLAALRFAATPFGTARAEPIQVTIPPGHSANQVATLLAQKGVVSQAWAFGWLLRFSGVDAKLKAGDYLFTLPQSPLDVARALSRGALEQTNVTIPEGLTVAETVDVIAAAGLGKKDELLAAFRDTQSIEDLDSGASDLEGYLFPETYRFVPGVPATSIAKTLVTTFRERFADKQRAAVQASGRSLRELVTIASLVEKETAAASERPQVAGVVVERLARGMKLQIDPTIIFARKLVGNWDGNIRRVDLVWDHPYNTYVRTGLPPGPIASPGLAALQAALHPLKTGALYYVSRGDGTHVFSTSLAEHNRAVNRFQR